MGMNEYTDEQRAQLPGWIAKWREIGSSTTLQPDYDKAVSTAKEIYSVLKEPEPVVMRFASPLAATYGGYIAYSFLEAGEKIDESRIRALVDARMRKEALDVSPDMLERIKKNSAYWSHYRGCQLWTGWACYVTFLRDVCGYANDTIKHFHLEESLAHNAGWIWAGEGVCTLSDRATSFNLDEDNHLHNDNGPAIGWSDGWGIYNLHSVSIRKEMLEHTPEQIMGVENAEQRMALIRRIGLQNMLARLDYKLVDARPFTPETAQKYATIPEGLENEYEVLEIKMEDQAHQFLRMINPSTGEIHIEGIDDAASIVKDALAFRIGVEASEYSEPVFIA